MKFLALVAVASALRLSCVADKATCCGASGLVANSATTACCHTPTAFTC